MNQANKLSRTYVTLLETLNRYRGKGQQKSLLNTSTYTFISLGESWCDTTTEVGRLMLTIMGGIAEFERGLIRKRCEEGIERAKRKGVTFGRKRKLDREMVRVAAERYAKGETMAELAEVYGVSDPNPYIRASSKVM